ncbi:hypothetical protein [Oricola indica]|uniref:hypothetical protein n=1 Tax=Oricola indica TaxID=2872591 RepID=UPI003CCB74A9
MATANISAHEAGATDDLSISELATIDFDPWPVSPDKWQPPTNEQWCNAINPTLTAARVAFVSMHKSKDQLVGIVSELEKDGVDVLDSIQHAQAFIDPIKSVLDAAYARMLIASAAAIEEEGGDTAR